jgi:hypothetical protein
MVRAATTKLGIAESTGYRWLRCGSELGRQRCLASLSWSPQAGPSIPARNLTAPRAGQPHGRACRNVGATKRVQWIASPPSAQEVRRRDARAAGRQRGRLAGASCVMGCGRGKCSGRESDMPEMPLPGGQARGRGKALAELRRKAARLWARLIW